MLKLLQRLMTVFIVSMAESTDCPFKAYKNKLIEYSTNIMIKGLAIVYLLQKRAQINALAMVCCIIILFYTSRLYYTHFDYEIYKRFTMRDILRSCHITILA